MTQVFLLKTSTSPWTVPSDFQTGFNLDTTGLSSYSSALDIGNSLSISSGNCQIGAQTFTTPSTGAGAVTKVSVLVGIVGSPTDQIQLQIYSGSPSGSSSQTGWGTLLGTSGGISPSGAPTLTAFTFSTAVELSASTSYTFVLSRTGSLDNTNYYQIGASPTDVYSGGGLFAWNGLTWTDAGTVNLFDTGFVVNGNLHTVEAITAGGNAAAGTTGASGVGGGGGGGGGYSKLTYSSGTMTPGTTTVPFVVSAGGSAGILEWESTTLSNCYSLASGANASGSTGGAGTGSSGWSAAGTPPITYTIGPSTAGGTGGSTGKNFGGPGGGGTGGPAAAGGNGGSCSVSGTGGGGGGGSNNGTSGNGTNALSASGANGGQGSSGSPGTTQGSSGTGDSGGAGSTAISTAGSPSHGGTGGGTDTTFDATHGLGGAGAGSGAQTSNNTSTITGGNAGSFGAGGGGVGYGRGTTTFVVGTPGDAIIAVSYMPAPPPSLTLGYQQMVMM